MNLNLDSWKEFKLGDIFIIKYGVNLELNSCDEIVEVNDDGINFVSRTSENNGVSAKVKKVDGVEVQSAGLISIAGGGSVLSIFLQNEPFYSGRDLYTLEAKDDIAEEAKFFLITVIEKNKYKYSYGRQANKTMSDIILKLPIEYNVDRTPLIDKTHKYSKDGYTPDWKFMENYIKSLHYKPLTTVNMKTKKPLLILETWKDFLFGNLITDIYKAHAYTAEELEESCDANSIRYITRTDLNNGCEMRVSPDGLQFVEDGNAITIGDTTATCFYQSEKFVTGDHMVIIHAEWLNELRALFILSVLSKEKYKYSYGRAFLMDRIKSTEIKLPVQYNEDNTPFIDRTYKYSKEGYVPDWKFMENYIKSLPYGDRL